MPTTDCPTGMGVPEIEVSEPPRHGASKPLKGLLLGFAATVTVGLALASWYLGVRIVNADEGAPSSVTTTSVKSAPVPAPAAPPADNASTQDNSSIAEAYWYKVPPASLYLQVAALGPKQDAGFLRALEARGFSAQIQSSDDDHARILIGPYSTSAEMQAAQRKLESMGVLAIETTH